MVGDVNTHNAHHIQMHTTFPVSFISRSQINIIKPNQIPIQRFYFFSPYKGPSAIQGRGLLKKVIIFTKRVRCKKCSLYGHGGKKKQLTVDMNRLRL